MVDIDGFKGFFRQRLKEIEAELGKVEEDNRRIIKKYNFAEKEIYDDTQGNGS